MASPFLLPYLSNLRRPAQRLTLEELLSMQDDFQPAPRPAARRSLQDLDPVDRREVRQQSALQALAALGASMQTGDWRHAGVGAGQIADFERGSVDAANARAERTWQEEQAQAAQIHQQKERQRSTAALFGMYERAVEGEDPEGPWARRAEAAARAGSMSELAQMASDDTKGKRNFVRSKGLNPDLFGDNQKAEADLLAEIERANKAADWEGEKQRLAEKAEAENQARLALEQKMREEKLGTYQPPDPPQYEPLDRIAAREELVQSIRDKHEKARSQGAGSVTRIGQLSNGLWAEIHRADEAHPRGWVVPIDGQPEVKGKLTSYSKDGTRFVINQDRPDLGAVAVKEFEEGDEGAPSVQQIMRPPKSGAGITAVEAAAAKRLAAVGDPEMRKKIAAARASGYSDAEIAAYLGIH